MFPFFRSSGDSNFSSEMHSRDISNVIQRNVSGDGGGGRRVEISRDYSFQLRMHIASVEQNDEYTTTSARYFAKQ